MITTCNFWNSLTESAKQNGGGSNSFLSPPGLSDPHPRLVLPQEQTFPFFSFGECVHLTPAKASQLLAHICLSLTLADPLEKETV